MYILDYILEIMKSICKKKCFNESGTVKPNPSISIKKTTPMLNPKRIPNHFRCSLVDILFPHIPYPTNLTLELQ